MTKAYYPAVFHIEEDNTGYCVEFPDIQGCLTNGENEKDNLLAAKELIHVVIKGLVEDVKEIPTPTPLTEVALEKNERVLLISTNLQ